MAKKVDRRIKGRLVPGSLYSTKTAAGHFAKGYRGGRFGTARKPRGSVKVQKVGKQFGVFDYSNPSERL